MRRQRDFVIYPLAVGGGDYSDSYIQIENDTVLRLRSEMTPDSALKPLSGLRIEGFPSSNQMGAVVEAAPAVVEVAPAVSQVQSTSSEEEDEEMDFDMEWE